VVAHTGAACGPSRVRPLNRPRPLRVEVDESDRAVALWLSGRRHAVETVLEIWRIDDEWWRERPVSRVYYSFQLEDGRAMTAYQDVVSEQWAKQGY
jgi:hypothetical protein